MSKKLPGIVASSILLPRTGFEKWAVVACDQFTSQPDYWEETERTVASAPSTLRLMLPEIYLEAPDKAQRIERVHAAMREYLQSGTLHALPPGAVLVNRDGRLGLVVAFDLEQYEYAKGSQPMIRATEGTIVERIPPRQEIRREAPLELPHILILLDDPDKTVVEPLAAMELESLYDFDLMQGGGHISGRFVPQSVLEGIAPALNALLQKAGNPPLLYAVGDGNHSLATAKACWEEIKGGLSAQERETHPARYALAELGNLHDPHIVFEPIHRVITGAPDAAEAFPRLAKALFSGGGRSVQFITPQGETALELPSDRLAVAAVDELIEAYMKQHPGAAVDYIHGDGVLRELAGAKDSAGFLLEGMAKDELFPAVRERGALPKKTFSMGDAHEKRYYLECRAIKE